MITRPELLRAFTRLCRASAFAGRWLYKLAWQSRAATSIRTFGFKTCLSLTILIFKSFLAANAVTLDEWQWPNPLPQRNTLTAVAFGSGQWVAVGAGGTILTSTDATTWTVRKSGTQNPLASVSYGNGLWVALAGDTILTSRNAIDWTKSTTVGGMSLSGVTYGNGLWVVVGVETANTMFGAVQKGAILTSPNGISWTPRMVINMQNLPLFGVSFGNGRFVAAGGQTSYRSDGAFIVGSILVSFDGINWSERHGGNILFSDLSYGNGRWLAVGYVSTAPRTIPPPFPSYAGAMLTSTDGSSWTPQDYGKTDILSGIEFGNGQWVALGFGGSISSPDGTSWKTQPFPNSNKLLGIHYGNGLWVAVGGAGAIFTAGQIRGSPRLSITRSGASVIVAWHSDATGFVLETTTNVAAPQSWKVIATTPTLANSQNSITDAVSGSARFYRLRQP